MKTKYPILDGDEYPTTPMANVANSKTKADVALQKQLLSVDKIADLQTIIIDTSWVTCHSPPDALFANNMVARYPTQPAAYDMKRALRVAHYLIGSMGLRLCIGGQGGVRVFATVDTSCATHDDLKSHSMWTLYHGTGGSFISRTRKHSIMTDSSTYAELVGAHLSIRDIQWARNFLNEVGYNHLQPTVLLIVDIQSTLKIIAKQHYAGKTKRVEIRYKMITEKVNDGEIACEHLPTHIIISDIGTKALSARPFLLLRRYLLGFKALPMILEKLGLQTAE